MEGGPGGPRARPDERRLGAWRSLLDAHSMLVERLALELEDEAGISLAWYDCLLALNTQPGRRLRMHELARRLRFTKGGVSQLVDKLEVAGLVRREPCREDRRGSFAVLTPAGRRTFALAAGVHLRGIQEHFGARLDDRDVAALEGILKKVRSGLVPAR